MYIFFKKYSNSVLATVLSFLGSALALSGLVFGTKEFLSGENAQSDVKIWIGMAIAGVILSLFSKWLGERKILKTLKKNVKEQNMEANIRASTELAVAIYNKAPCKPVQKYITELNPAAGEIINQKKSSK